MSRFFLCVLICVSLPGMAKTDPSHANAIERGYEVIDDTVFFPDGSSCAVRNFNNGDCGENWMEVDYCVEEGKQVWNKDKCCDGLEATGEKGNKRCTEEKNDTVSWFESIADNTMFWIGLLLPFLLLIFVSVSIKRKMNQNK